MSLLDQLKRPPVPPYLFWSLTRLGARQQFYGPLNTVVHPQVAEKRRLSRPEIDGLLARGRRG